MENKEIRMRCLECAIKIVVLKLKVGSLDLPMDQTLADGSIRDRVMWTIQAAHDMEKYVEEGTLSGEVKK